MYIKKLAVMALLAAVMLAYSTASHGDEVTEKRGIYLYQQNCASCHGKIEKTTKPGRRPARIRSAIKNNIGGMGRFMDKLTDEDIEAVSEALSLVEPPQDADGAALYEMYCAACHRPLENTDLKGKSFEDVKAGIKDRMCQTVNLRFLDDDQLEQIADALKADGD